MGVLQINIRSHITVVKVLVPPQTRQQQHITPRLLQVQIQINVQKKTMNLSDGKSLIKTLRIRLGGHIHQIKLWLPNGVKARLHVSPAKWKMIRRVRWAHIALRQRTFQ